jgi:hypothetical protein
MTAYSDAAAVVQAANLQALNDLQTKAQAFIADVTAIAATVQGPAGFVSDPQRIVNTLLNNVRYTVSNDLANAIRTATAAATTATA